MFQQTNYDSTRNSVTRMLEGLLFLLMNIKFYCSPRETQNFSQACANLDSNLSYLFLLVVAPVCKPKLNFNSTRIKVQLLWFFSDRVGIVAVVELYASTILQQPYPTLLAKSLQLQQQRPSSSTSKNLQLIVLNTPTSTNVISISYLCPNLWLSNSNMYVII